MVNEERYFDLDGGGELMPIASDEVRAVSGQTEMSKRVLEVSRQVDALEQRIAALDAEFQEQQKRVEAMIKMITDLQKSAFGLEN